MVSKIQWTDETWNPVRGCSRVSEGCRNCYAEVIAGRFSGRGQAFEGFATRSPNRWTGKVELVRERLEDPISWRKPRRIFVNSMSDLFHDALTDDDIQQVFSVMEATQRHAYQILTKRPARMLDWVTKFDKWLRYAGNVTFAEKLKNVWLGVSIEDQETANRRIPLLQETPAAVRFVSYEPALGPVDFNTLCGSGVWYETENKRIFKRLIDGVDLIIFGGESGPDARYCNVEWAQKTIKDCKGAGVAVFIKQLGSKPLDWRSSIPEAPPYEFLLQDRKGGDIEEWPEELRVREMPQINQ